MSIKSWWPNGDQHIVVVEKKIPTYEISKGSAFIGHSFIGHPILVQLIDSKVVSKVK